jgi:hypothetical protein
MFTGESAMSFMMLATLLFVQASIDPSGHWEGIVQVPDSQIAIEIDLARDRSGSIAGAFAQPGENLRGLPLAGFSVEGRTLRFQIKGKTGERVFAGTLSPDGKELKGDFTQNGYQMPFVLTRTGDSRLEAPAKIAAVTRQLEGAWNATLNVRGADVQLVLTMANQPDGSATASLMNTGDGLEIPVTMITQEAGKVTLQVKAIDGSYTGVINSDGTELVGTFSEHGKTAPLTFRRASK